ncbi:MAG: hypothetical protein KIS92_06550 [Planctomycetota bacterium]|nr:hypothetical protein [Planctomycetota bacterium]
MARAAMLLAVACAFGAPIRGAEDEKPVFTVIFTAEAHGALLPCDCPLQPLGGVARRAALIKQYRSRGPVVLVDAGGWAAGGIYDDDSDGNPERDRLRTDLMAKAMALMKYDAMFDAAGKSLPLPPQYFPGERDIILNEIDLDAAAEKASGLARVMAVALPGNDGKAMSPAFKVGLARIGEEALNDAVAQKQAADLVISAGRKTSTRISWTVGGTVVANFDYQVQRLGIAEVFQRKDAQAEGGVRWDVRVTQVPLTPEIAPDAEIDALLAPHLDRLRKKGKQVVEIEFWTLPECPYCAKFEPDLAKIAEELGDRVRIVPRFLVEKNPGGGFSAMHGPRELEEARIQAIVADYDPKLFFPWVQWREQHPEAPWEDGAKELGIVKGRIAGALDAGRDQELFERDYQLSLQRRVQGTPTLVFSNKIYEGELERLRVLRALCGMLDAPKPAVCATVPACFADAECRKRGFVGKCREAGTPQAACDYAQKAVPVPVTVLLEPETIYSNHERILEILLARLPGMAWRVLDPASDEGRALAEKVKPDRYPAYLIDPAAKSEWEYKENFEGSVEERAGWLLLKSEVQGAHRIAGRPRIPGRVDLFAARSSQPGTWAVEIAVEAKAWRQAPDVVLHDALFWNERRSPDGQVTRELAARGGLAEIEDAALAQAVRMLAPEKLDAYLLERGKRRASQFGWDRALEKAGVDVARARTLAEGPDGAGPVPEVAKALRAEADLLEQLKAGGDVVLLGENCEVIPVRSREELRYYLEQIGKRKK